MGVGGAGEGRLCLRPVVGWSRWSAGAGVWILLVRAMQAVPSAVTRCLSCGVSMEVLFPQINENVLKLFLAIFSLPGLGKPSHRVFEPPPVPLLPPKTTLRPSTTRKTQERRDAKVLPGRESRRQVSISASWYLGGSLLGGLVFGSHLLGQRGGCLWGALASHGWDQDAAK